MDDESQHPSQQDNNQHPSQQDSTASLKSLKTPSGECPEPDAGPEKEVETPGDETKQVETPGGETMHQDDKTTNEVATPTGEDETQKLKTN